MPKCLWFSQIVESLIRGESSQLVDRENNKANVWMGLNLTNNFFRKFCYNCDFKMHFMSPLLKKG